MGTCTFHAACRETTILELSPLITIFRFQIGVISSADDLKFCGISRILDFDLVVPESLGLVD